MSSRIKYDKLLDQTLVWNTQSFHLLGWILVSMFAEWKNEF